MDQNDALKMLIEDAVRRVTAPLEAEIKALRAELEALKAPTPSSAPPSVNALSAAIEPTPTEPVQTPASSEPVSNLGVNTEVPAERTDFMRFLQRGLEQEEKEYAEREDVKPEKKRGWNPFKR
jgi:hypothetical protein